MASRLFPSSVVRPSFVHLSCANTSSIATFSCSHSQANVDTTPHDMDTWIPSPFSHRFLGHGLSFYLLLSCVGSLSSRQPAFLLLSLRFFLVSLMFLLISPTFLTVTTTKVHKKLNDMIRERWASIRRLLDSSSIPSHRNRTWTRKAPVAAKKLQTGM